MIKRKQAVATLKALWAEVSSWDWLGKQRPHNVARREIR